ncbi:MAG: hypothetical protein AAGU74_02785 [Bacillota bacterium]
MTLTELNRRHQLSFDEYVEEWRSLIALFYFRALHPELTEQDLGLNSTSVVNYSMELSAALIYVAMSIWALNRVVPADSRNRVSSAVVEQFYKDLHNGLSPKSQAEWTALCKKRQDAYAEVYNNLACADINKRREDVGALAQELVGRISSRHETLNARAIKRIGNILILATSAFKELADHSEPDAEVVRGKPRFILNKQANPNVIASRWDR